MSLVSELLVICWKFLHLNRVVVVVDDDDDDDDDMCDH